MRVSSLMRRPQTSNRRLAAIALTCVLLLSVFVWATILRTSSSAVVATHHGTHNGNHGDDSPRQRLNAYDTTIQRLQLQKQQQQQKQMEHQLHEHDEHSSNQHHDDDHHHNMMNHNNRPENENEAKTTTDVPHIAFTDEPAVLVEETTESVAAALATVAAPSIPTPASTEGRSAVASVVVATTTTVESDEPTTTTTTTAAPPPPPPPPTMTAAPSSTEAPPPLPSTTTTEAPDPDEPMWTARRNKYNAMPLSAENFMRKIGVDRRYTDTQHPRIVCATYTYNVKHKEASETSLYWAQNCTKHFIFTNSEEPKLELHGSSVALNISQKLNGDFGYFNVWHRVRYMLEFFYESNFTKDYDFFLLGGDDVLVVLENLRKFLLSSEVWPLHMKGEPLHLGHLMHTLPGDAFHSGAGHILNNKALELYYRNRNHPSCRPEVHSFAEDVFLAECLRTFGCRQRDTFDPHGEDRIIIVPAGMVVEQAKNPNYTWWYGPYHRNRGVPQKVGNQVASVNAFLIHYMSGDLRKQTREMIYRLGD